MEDLQLFVNSIVDLFRVEYRLRPTDQVMALLKSDGDKVFRVPLQSLEHVTFRQHHEQDTRGHVGNDLYDQDCGSMKNLAPAILLARPPLDEW